MIRSEIRYLIIGAILDKFGAIDVPDFSVAPPDNSEHGDYATNAALILAKYSKKPPMEIARDIVAQLTTHHLQLTTKIEIAPPGFINFWTAQEKLLEELQEILRRGKHYGTGSKKEEKIQVEFISANPTGPLTIANGRGGFWGEVLSRALEFSGYDIEKEYYINDAGNQILTLGKSFLATAGVIPEEDNFYKGAYIKKWAVVHRALVKKYSSDPMRLGREAARDFLKDIKAAVKKAGIKFDRFTSEHNHIYKRNFVKKALVYLRRAGAVYEKDGAVWLKTTKFDDDKDRVLITSDGFPTYFLSDVGHYLETKSRGFDVKINILGPDHYGYVKRIQAAARLLHLKKSELIVTQAVRVVSEGKEVRMSKRRGEFLAFNELIKEVGPDAARYFFLEKSPDTHMDFDLDLAKERSVKNPVYYIQYAHARIASIFRKAKNRTYNLQLITYNRLKEKEELDLIKKLIQFPEAVEDVASDYQVHRLTRYAYELARSFHNFYEKHRVISEDTELTQARLALVKAAQIVLQSVLGLLGISVPRRM